MGKVSALSCWDIHSYNSDNNYSLLYSAASIYVFYNKDRFANFRRATKDQKMVCDINTITIEG